MAKVLTGVRAMKKTAESDKNLHYKLSLFRFIADTRLGFSVSPLSLATEVIVITKQQPCRRTSDISIFRIKLAVLAPNQLTVNFVPGQESVLVKGLYNDQFLFHSLLLFHAVIAVFLLAYT